MKNILFALEGPDGAGKSTMAKDIQNDILKNYKAIKVKVVSLPNSSCFAYKKIRETLQDPSRYPPDVFQSLFIANMIDCAEKIINPFLTEQKEDRICILDRSLISTIIYNNTADGTLFNSMMNYTYKFANNLVKGSLGPTDVDFDIINKIYGHLIYPIDVVFFLLPPIKILIQHAENKKSSEENDSVDAVVKNYEAYKIFHQFLTGNLHRNIIEQIENSNRLLIPDVRNFDKFVSLSTWNNNKSEEENYLSLKGEILARLNL